MGHGLMIVLCLFQMYIKSTVLMIDIPLFTGYLNRFANTITNIWNFSVFSDTSNRKRPAPDNDDNGNRDQSTSSSESEQEALASTRKKIRIKRVVQRLDAETAREVTSTIKESFEALGTTLTNIHSEMKEQSNQLTSLEQSVLQLKEGVKHLYNITRNRTGDGRNRIGENLPGQQHEQNIEQQQVNPGPEELRGGLAGHQIAHNAGPYAPRYMLVVQEFVLMMSFWWVELKVLSGKDKIT